MILMLLFVCCLKSPEGRTTFIPPYGTSTNLRVTSRTKTREVIKMLMTKFQVCLLKYQNFSYISCLVICLLVGEMNWNFPLPELGTQKGNWLGYLSNQGTVIWLGLIHLVSQVEWFFNVQYKEIQCNECHGLFSTLKKATLNLIWEIYMTYNLLVFLSWYNLLVYLCMYSFYLF